MNVTIVAGVVTVSMLAAPAAPQSRESSTCQSDIVSSTAVSSFCGHHEGENEVLDLVILWRGAPGWFGTGASGSGGSGVIGGTKGIVSQHTSYGTATIAFSANFDTGTATVGQSTITLDHLNTIIVDEVGGDWRIVSTRWTEPELPLVGDWNLTLARRSREFVRDLRCEIPMPAPVSFPRVPILTVCEKLKKQ